jgi:hypothetical protein
LREKVKEYEVDIASFEKKVEKLEDRISVEVNSKEEELREVAKN